MLISTLALQTSNVAGVTIAGLAGYGLVLAVGSWVLKIFLAYHVYQTSKNISDQGRNLAFFPPALWGLFAFFVTPFSTGLIPLLALFALLHFTSWFSIERPHWERTPSANRSTFLGSDHAERVRALEAELDELRRRSGDEA